jgi:hypothetical protein
MVRSCVRVLVHQSWFSLLCSFLSNRLKSTALEITCQGTRTWPLPGSWLKNIISSTRQSRESSCAPKSQYPNDVTFSNAAILAASSDSHEVTTVESNTLPGMKRSLLLATIALAIASLEADIIYVRLRAIITGYYYYLYVVQYYNLTRNITI